MPGLITCRFFPQVGLMLYLFKLEEKSVFFPQQIGDQSKSPGQLEMSSRHRATTTHPYPFQSYIYS